MMAKEPVKLRFKMLANGSRSAYLDMYIHGKRTYEFLRMYIVPERTSADKEQNKATLRAANAIKAQRVIELTNERAGISKASSRAKMLLVDWIRNYNENKKATGHSKSLYLQINKLARHLVLYRGDKVRMAEVDKEYCTGFLQYLKNAKRKDGMPMAKATAATYFTVFTCVLNAAVKEDIIAANPVAKISTEDKIKVPESTREYLTIDEIKTLANTECICEVVKRAFMFSCFSGMRISDIQALTWENIETDCTQYRVKIVMQKTLRPLYIPLSSSAVKWLPERNGAGDADKVFHMPSRTYIGLVMKSWVLTAGIKKSISFHCARHTFATTLLTKGADLYTTSKLLGHSKVETTQIYTKIIDRKKQDAVSLMDDIL